MKLILSTLLLFMLALPSHAFEPDKHEEFSRRAAEVYQTCTGHVIPPQYIRAFAEGSAHEDDPALSRILNWHFYNRDKKIGYYWKLFLYCDGLNEHIFNERLNALKDMINARKPLRDIYEVAGRAVHHIQDMSSPPHVAPIYHVGDDNFDKYKFNKYKSSTISDKDAAQICKELNGKDFKTSEILNQAAMHTLKVIESPVVFDNGKTIEGETWMKFWGGPNDEDLSGFKTYGKYKNNFGNIENIKKYCEGEICSAYNENIFDKFYNERYIRAVTDTVRLLIYIDKRIKD